MSRQRSLFEFANINLCRVCIEGRQDGKIANVTPQRFIEYGAVSHMEPARLLIAHAQLNIGAAMKAKSYFRNQSSFRRQINKTKIRKRPTSSNQNQSLSHERLEPRCMLAGAGIAGTLDLNFGVNGFATINPEDGSTGGGANSVAIQSDGKIVVGGYTYVASPAHAALSLARFNTDGTLDATFGTNGIYTDSVVRNLSISYGEFQFAVAIRDISIDSQGRIVGVAIDTG